MESDPEAYNCDTCEVRQKWAELDRDNVRAWTVFQQVGTRFCRETQTSAVVLEKLAGDDDPDDFADLVARLSILYAYFVPVRVQIDGP